MIYTFTFIQLAALRPKLVLGFFLPNFVPLYALFLDCMFINYLKCSHCMSIPYCTTIRDTRVVEKKKCPLAKIKLHQFPKKCVRKWSRNVLSILLPLWLCFDLYCKKWSGKTHKQNIFNRYLLKFASELL